MCPLLDPPEAVNEDGCRATVYPGEWHEQSSRCLASFASTTIAWRS